MLNIENYRIQWCRVGGLVYSHRWVISYNSIFISHRSILGSQTHYYEHTFSNTGISLVQPTNGCDSAVFSLGI